MSSREGRPTETGAPSPGGGTFSRLLRGLGKTRDGILGRLKDLVRENARLKKLVAEQALDKAILEEALKGNY